MDNLETKARGWVMGNAELAQNLESEYYCESRDRFDVRLAAMAMLFTNKKIIDEEKAYFIKSIAGEIGNNSFDHNMGNWPDVPGIFFGYDIAGQKHTVVLADRGQGIFATLKQVKPELQNDEEALATAFTERLSARMPERRGNGLKFVRESIASLRLHLDFFSGKGKVELNDNMAIQPSQKEIRGCLAILTFQGNI